VEVAVGLLNRVGAAMQSGHQGMLGHGELESNECARRS
jgi:hypothetical protein